MENPEAAPPRNLPDADGAEYTRLAGRPVPAHHGEPAAEYVALEAGAAVLDLSHRTILRLAGKKAVGMLNAVVTNEVPEEDNLGVYALFLNPKGRIQTDLRVLKSAGDVLIDTEPEGAPAAKELLGRYAPFYRVEIEDLSEADVPWGIFGLYGPQAKELLDDLELAEHESAQKAVGGAAVLAAGITVPVPGYDLLGPVDALRAVRDYLTRRAAVLAGLHAYETMRVVAGIPRFGSDITPENFPAEAGILERAVSFEKGCYPGQETVARMHYRGHPNRVLRRFAIEGTPPSPETAILQNGKQVGKVTSLAPLPVKGETFALGYLSRNADTQNALRAGDATLHPLV
jgi:folate-binding protein YgfZ